MDGSRRRTFSDSTFPKTGPTSTHQTTHKRADTQTHKRANTQTHKRTNTQPHKHKNTHTNAQTHKHTNAQTRERANTRKHANTNKHTSTQAHKQTSTRTHTHPSNHPHFYSTAQFYNYNENRQFTSRRISIPPSQKKRGAMIHANHDARGLRCTRAMVAWPPPSLICEQ